LYADTFLFIFMSLFFQPPFNFLTVRAKSISNVSCNIIAFTMRNSCSLQKP
jgi:hypothetical protein